MPPTPDLPLTEVVERLGISVTRELGGRLNRHWAVTRQDERLVLRRWHGDLAQVSYETAVLAALSESGWTVPVVVDDPIEVDGAQWTLSPELPGAKRRETTVDEERQRGVLLAEFHRTTASAIFDGIGRRPGWRDAAATLADDTIDDLLRAAEGRLPREARLLREHLDLARGLFDADAFAALPTVIIHGDWTVDNLLFDHGRLTGVLDLELARRDVRIADFGLSWRGKYDDLVLGYDAASPLTEAERRLIVPVRWAFLIESAAELLAHGDWDDDWIAAQLQRRTPLLRELSGL